MNNGTKPIQPEAQANSSAELPDKNEARPMAESLSAVNHAPTESTGTDPFDDPIFVDVTDQYIGKGILIIGAGSKAK
jgi:hypothetical protein